MFNYRSSPPQSGFSLLEALIAVLLFSIGMLGFAEAEWVALRHNETTYFQNLAISNTLSLSEKLIACEESNNCLNSEIYLWKSQIPTLLPQAETNVFTMPQGFQIKIKWQTKFSSQFKLDLAL